MRVPAGNQLPWRHGHRAAVRGPAASGSRAAAGRRLPVTIAVVLAAALLAACHDEEGAVTPSPSASPTAPSSSSPSPAASASPSPPALPASCGALLTDADLSAALGRNLPGRTTYLSAAPIPASGRTGRSTCGFGVTPDATGAEVTPVEISLIGYVDEATANERIALTVAESRAEGETVTEQPLGPRTGYLILTATGHTYVVADGRRTLVIRLLAGVVPADAVPSAVEGIATAVLRANPAEGATRAAVTLSPS